MPYVHLPVYNKEGTNFHPKMTLLWTSSEREISKSLFVLQCRSFYTAVHPSRRNASTDDDVPLTAGTAGENQKVPRAAIGSVTVDPVRWCEMSPYRLPVARWWATAVVATLLFSQRVGPVRAGFACLSSPCAHGVCVDQLNRQASLDERALNSSVTIRDRKL